MKDTRVHNNMATHFQSLLAAFQRVRDGLTSTLRVLEQDIGDWPFFDPKLAIEKLMTSSILLEGLLDGLCILVQELHSDSDELAVPASFCTTDFPYPEMASIQQEMRNVRSNHPDGLLYVNFWTMVEYWKHYYPHTMLPSRIGRCKDYCIKLGLGDQDTSGPIMKDIILPTFNATRQLLLLLKAKLGTDDAIPDALRTA